MDEFKQRFLTVDSTSKLQSGHYLGNDDKTFFQGELINYTKTPQRLYLQIDVEYMPGKQGNGAFVSFSSVTGELKHVSMRG